MLTNQAAPDPALTLAEIARLCSDGMPLPTASQEEGVFAEPWQAHAFAMTLQLHERGLFTWPEWAQVFSAQIKEAQLNGDPDDGSSYYNHWLAALEKMILSLNIGSEQQVQQLQQAWSRAADRTPHGRPILLEPQDLKN